MYFIFQNIFYQEMHNITLNWSLKTNMWIADLKRLLIFLLNSKSKL